MAEFSYASDIAPLRSTFFPASGMTRLESQQLAARSAKEIDPLDTKIRETRQNLIKAVEADNAFEMQKLQVEEAKRVAKMKADTDSRLPMLMTELDTVLNNPSSTPNQKAVEYGKIAMRYSNLATYNPAASTLLSGAGKQVTTLQANEEDQYRKNAAIDQKRMAGIEFATRLGDAEAVKKLSTSTDPAELASAYGSLSTRVAEEKKKEDERALAKAKYDQEEKARSARLDMYKGMEVTLRSVGRSKLDDETVVGSTTNRTAEDILKEQKQEAERLKQLKISEADRIRMKQMWKVLHPDKKETDAPSDDNKLFTDLTNKVFTGIVTNSGGETIPKAKPAEISAWDSAPAP